MSKYRIHGSITVRLDFDEEVDWDEPTAEDALADFRRTALSEIPWGLNVVAGLEGHSIVGDTLKAETLEGQVGLFGEAA